MLARMRSCVLNFFIIAIAAVILSSLCGFNPVNTAEADGSGEDVALHTSHTEWTAITSSVQELRGGTDYPAYYFLANDIQLDGTLRISGKVVLCLNGNILYADGAQSYGAIFASGGAELTLCDCRTECPHSYYEGQDGMPVFCGSDSRTWAVSQGQAVRTLYGGVITGGNCSRGGAIYATGATVLIYGGNIVGNRASAGGGIYMRGSTLSVYGGKIFANSSANGQALYAYGGDTVIYGGYIKGDMCAEGGSVSVCGGYFGQHVDEKWLSSGVISVFADETLGDADFNSEYPYAVYKAGRLEISAPEFVEYDGLPIAEGEDFKLLPSGAQVNYSYTTVGQGQYAYGLPAQVGNYTVIAQNEYGIFDPQSKFYYEKGITVSFAIAVTDNLPPSDGGETTTPDDNLPPSDGGEITTPDDNLPPSDEGETTTPDDNLPPFDGGETQAPEGGEELDGLGDSSADGGKDGLAGQTETENKSFSSDRARGCEGNGGASGVSVAVAAVFAWLIGKLINARINRKGKGK